MANDWWNSEVQNLSQDDELLKFEQFDDEFVSFEHELIRPSSLFDIAETGYENEFYLHYTDSECCNMDGLRNSPTLAELNGHTVDDFELIDSTFSYKKCPGVDSPRQLTHQSSVTIHPIEHDGKHLSDNVSPNRHDQKCMVELQADKLSSLKCVRMSSVNCYSGGDTQTCTLPQSCDEMLYAREALQSEATTRLNLKKRFLHAEDACQSDTKFLGTSSDVKSSINPAVSTVQKWLTPARDKGGPPCKKVKEEVICDKVSEQHSVAAESNWSSVADSDDSDIENFEENVSDEDAVTSASVDHVSDGLVVNCGGVEVQKRYFWLYNVQAKGPKCRQSSVSQALKASSVSDPHVLHSFEDPAVSDLSPKGRRARGSDIDPNPRRLMQIGAELHRLSAVVNRPSNSPEASLSPREKNKFASRICRLKRKAQHEANKIKLQGLDSEHNELMSVIAEIKRSIIQRVREMTHVSDQREGSSQAQSSLASKFELLVKMRLSDMIAEHTNEYVSCELEKVKNDNKNRRV